MTDFEPDEWALVLGGSSGFGLATAKALAFRGMSVCIVHRDRRGALPRITAEFDAIRSYGRGFLAVNVDALSPEGQTAVLDALTARLGERGRVRVLLHSIAYGNLKPIAPGAADVPRLEEEDLARTIHAMGTSLLTWVQAIFSRGLFAADARVFGLTSEGARIAWGGYAAVGAAKAALEAISRAIAVEFAPYGIRSNILQAGITETPALHAIPGAERLCALAAQRNPFRRLTHPEDVAEFICLMAAPGAAWVNGAVIPVDGGERIAPL